MRYTQHLLLLVVSFVFFAAKPSQTTTPQQFWADYTNECEFNCHVNTWDSQSCSLANDCGCDGGGCLCLSDSCLCATVSWLTAVSQCIGATCGSAAIGEAAYIAWNGCQRSLNPAALTEQEIIDIGVAAMPGSSSSTTEVAHSPTTLASLPSTSSSTPSSPLQSSTTSPSLSPLTSSNPPSASTSTALDSTNTAKADNGGGSGGVSNMDQWIIGTVISAAGVVVAVVGLLWRRGKKKKKNTDNKNADDDGHLLATFVR